MPTLAFVLFATLLSVHLLPAESGPEFRQPQPNPEPVFPRWHGSHPDFRIEWWYLTGHLWDAEQRRYGFQATFFRQANRPGLGPESVQPIGPAFGTEQVFLAHMAITNLQARTFLHEERLNRNGWDAYAETETLSLRNGNWTLRMIDPVTESMELRGTIRSEAKFHLRLFPEKPLVLFGPDGISRKSADAGSASYYLTFPRLRVEGDLTWQGDTRVVRGQAWMDHEISSSQLTREQTGWDWVSMQLENGYEIMAFRLRREDGSVDPFSAIAWVDPAGSSVYRYADAFTWEELREWKSPRTGATYPISFRIETTQPWTGQPVTLRFVPLMDEQELDGAVGGIAYWEGAGRILDETGRVLGEAYAELTGYTESLSGRL